MKSKALVFIFLLCVWLQPLNALAGVTVVQALTFGTFIIRNNDAQYDIIINPDGSSSYNSTGLIEIFQPQEGIFDIDSLTPNATISSVVITQIGSLQNVGEDLQMLDFQSTHNNVNGSGVARIVVGATARTSGTGVTYIDQTYTGTLQIQLNF